MGNLESFKTQVKNLKSKNFCFVSIRIGHRCHHCGTYMSQGTSCLTVNYRGRGRRWICDDCAALKLNIIEAKYRLNSVAFDDKGAAYACKDYLDELEAEFLSRKSG